MNAAIQFDNPWIRWQQAMIDEFLNNIQRTRLLPSLADRARRIRKGVTPSEVVYEEDRLKLAEFYRDRGYIDFEIKDVQFENPTPQKMIIRFQIYEGRQYRVGKIGFVGTTMLPTNAVSPKFDPGPAPQPGPERKAWADGERLHRAFVMKEGDIFRPKLLAKDIEAVEDFYGIKGHIDVAQSTGNLRVKRIANTDSLTRLGNRRAFDENLASIYNSEHLRNHTGLLVADIDPDRIRRAWGELPFNVGPEKVISKIKDLVGSKKLQGIADVKDLTDRSHGTQLVIEVKNGFVPEALLEQLYKLTPLEDAFHVNAVCLVDGQPRTLGLKELLEVYLGHRYDVVRRRSEFRRTKAQDRLHIVDGLLIAILDIDEVIQIIRSSEDAAEARGRVAAPDDFAQDRGDVPQQLVGAAGLHQEQIGAGSAGGEACTTWRRNP